ncbi:MAG: YezD family protein [Chloroflexota bacterium]
MADTTTPTATNTAPTAQEQAVLAEVLSAIRAVRYGYVQITLQDARVVQIDTLEKKRLDR